MEIEIWKPIVGYEGLYEVSNYGRVKSIERYVKQADHLRYVPERIKKTSSHFGYPVVTLCANRKSKMYPIHRLVAEAFIPNPRNKPFVDHINTDKTDFRICNLRWVDAKENANNITTLANCRERTYTPERSRKTLETKRKRGSVKGPKAVFQYTKEGQFVAEFESMEDAMRKTSIHATSIGRALDDHTQSAGGYMWFSSRAKVVEPYRKRYRRKFTKVSYYDKNGSLIKVFDSLAQAQEETGIHRENIVRNARLEGKARRYKFKLE